MKNKLLSLLPTNKQQLKIKQLENTIVEKEKIIINLRNKVSTMVDENRELDELRDKIIQLEQENKSHLERIEELEVTIERWQEEADDFKTNTETGFKDRLDTLEEIKYAIDTLCDNLDDDITYLRGHEWEV